MSLLKNLHFGLTILIGALVLTTPGALAAAKGQMTIVKENEKFVTFSADENGYEVSQVSREKLKATTKTQGDFNLSNRFSVEIEGATVVGVHTISGIDTEFDIVEYKDGEDGVSHTRPGNHKPGKMTVTKDWSNTSEWYKWRKAVLDGKVDRRSISVIFHNDAGEESGRLNAVECFPTSYNLLIDAIDAKAARQEVLELECTRLQATGINSPNL